MTSSVLTQSLPTATPPAPERLLRTVLALALPVMVEQVLHMVVGLTDTYLANHLPHDARPATAAVGTMTYVMWFISIIVGSRQ